jgi:hypothetical protein
LTDTNLSACLLNVTSIVNSVSVINASDGSINLTVTGGVPPYNYMWNNGDSTQFISHLTAGVYTVTISSIPACPAYDYSYTIHQPFDSINQLVDTLYSPIIDTCISFVVNNFYIEGITYFGNSVTVHWVFTGAAGDTASLFVSYTYSNTGPQLVVLTLNCGSKDLTTFMSYICINQPASIAEDIPDPEINLYPNPVSDILNITFGKLNSNSVSLKIYNTTGQQVYSQSIAGNTRQFGINVSDLAKGVYFVRINTENGKTIVKKFLK